MKKHIVTPPMVSIARDVLEAAKDNSDDYMAMVCRRYLDARRLGRDYAGRKADASVIMQFADAA